MNNYVINYKKKFRIGLNIRGGVISQTDDKIKILFKNVGEKEMLKKIQ